MATLSVDEIMEHMDRYSRESFVTIQMIKYFLPENLAKCALDPAKTNFSEQGDIVTKGQILLKKKGHQNCLVMLEDGKIYMHPKVRPSIHTQTCGINHSSLALGNAVEFAGSFVHNDQHGWVIENTTGHYGTRATKMRRFLHQLEQQGVPLDHLKVKLWIPKNPDNPGSEESEYTILIEDAKSFLKRTTKSMEHLNGLQGQDDGYKSADEKKPMSP